MPVSIRVTGQFQSVVHKGSSGISPATIPDVCKTPTPGGPVPMPYPNITQSMTLSSGTTSVKCDGAMAANKGSKFSMSNGDQPGTLGGVKSNVFMKESTWITYAFVVKMNNKCVCRFTDKKFQNAENTVNMAGEFQSPRDALLTLQQWVKECDQSVKKSEKGKKKSCQQLGREKHKCMEDKIQAYNDQKPCPTKPGDPGHPQGERGYDSKTGKEIAEKRGDLVKAGQAAGAKVVQDQGLTGKAARKAVGKEIGKLLDGKLYPDAAIDLGDGKKLFVDFKFPCPKGQPSGHKRGSRNKLSKGNKNTKMSKKQRDAYKKLAKATDSNKPPLTISPTGIRAY